MNNNWLSLLVIIAYMVAMIYFANYARLRQQKIEKEKGASAEGFLLSSKSFGKYLVMFTLVGSAIGANGTVGTAQNGYQFGISSGWFNGAFGIGIIFTALLFIKKLRRLNVTTLAEIYGDYYGESTRTLVALGQLFMIYTIMVVQFVAGGAILNSLMPEVFSFEAGMLISAAVYISIAMIGGLSSAAITNVVNIIVLYGSMIIAVILAISKVGGINAMINSLPNKEVFLHPIDGLSLIVIISFFALFFVNIPTGTATMQMAFSAKDEKSAFYGYLLAGLLVLPFGFVTALLGMSASILFPGLENSASALPMVVTTFHPIIAGLVLAGLWAAIVSSATTYILGGSAIIVNDIYRKLVKIRTTKQEIFVSKIGGLAFALVSLFTAFFIRTLIQFTTVGMSLSVGYFIVLIATLYFPKTCKRSTANLVIITGFLSVFSWYLIPAIPASLPHVVFLHLITCPIAFVIAYILDKRPAYFRTPEFKQAQIEKDLKLEAN